MTNQTTSALEPDLAATNSQMTLLLARCCNRYSLNTELDSLWGELAESLAPKAQALIDASHSVARDNVSLLAQMGGAARMLMLAKTEWEMTEVRPGDCAGLTYEQSPDDDRIAAREMMRRAVNLAGDVLATYEEQSNFKVNA